jgi:uncharacterized OB-fold protein
MHLPLFDPPAENDVARPFWDAIAEHELRLPRCSSCGRFQWYPDETGPDCDCATYDWVSVPTSGVLHTLTRVYRSFLPNVQSGLPFVVGFVELDGVDGARLVATLDDSHPLTIGDRVEAAFVEVEGRVRPLFRKTKDISAMSYPDRNGDNVAEEGSP